MQVPGYDVLASEDRGSPTPLGIQAPVPGFPPNVSLM
jgi:hypothetical protein